MSRTASNNPGPQGASSGIATPPASTNSETRSDSKDDTAASKSGNASSKKADKTDKADKAEKAVKADSKTEKADKAEKTDNKAEKAGNKTEKGGKSERASKEEKSGKEVTPSTATPSSTKTADSQTAKSQDEPAAQTGSAPLSTKGERPRSSVQFGEKDVKRASRLLHSALPKPSPKAAVAEAASQPANDANGPTETANADAPAKGNVPVSSNDKQEPAGQPNSANPKFRQAMPQSQPPAHFSGFRPQFIPGNFSSRGRGRGQFHPGHPANFGHRGGHHGGFYGHHQHHHHQFQHQHQHQHQNQNHKGAQPSSNASAPVNGEAIQAGNVGEESEATEANVSQNGSGEHQEAEEAKTVAVDVKATAEEAKETTSASTPKSLKTGTMIVSERDV